LCVKFASEKEKSSKNNLLKEGAAINRLQLCRDATQLNWVNLSMKIRLMVNKMGMPLTMGAKGAAQLGRITVLKIKNTA